MPKHKLTAAFLKSAPAGKHEDGAGLRLVKYENGGGKWVFRYSAHGRRPEMGLGSFDTITLAEARRQADHWRTVVAAGRDPILERERERRMASRADTSFAALTTDAFEARKAELKGDGKDGRWLSPLERHVLPRIGKVPVQEIDAQTIRDTLAPIWHEKGETARKAANRIGLVLKHAAALGLEVDMQAVDKARALLGKSRHAPRHIEALPWADVPAFYQSLDELTPVHLALRLLILTGLRSKPVRHLRLDQIEGDVWTVPGETMKGLKGKTADFRVPLSAEAMAVIEAAKPLARDGFLFPGAKSSVISDMAMSKFMRRRGLAARPHGFRTSLRTWISETTSAPHEVAEAMLAHVTDSAVVRAYRRTDFLDQRRSLSEAWAAFLRGERAEGANVVRLAEA